jgi:hypothetical protein
LAKPLCGSSLLIVGLAAQIHQGSLDAYADEWVNGQDGYADCVAAWSSPQVLLRWMPTKFITLLPETLLG